MLNRMHELVKGQAVGHGLYAAVTAVTPAMAQEFIDRAATNRKSSNVEKYSFDMTAHQWSLNGESLIFDKDGSLLDGLNRCRACVLSQTPFVTMVTYGVAELDGSSLDTGKSKTLLDAMVYEYPKFKIEHRNVVGYIAKRAVLVSEERPFTSGTPTTRREELAALKNNVSRWSECAARLKGSSAPRYQQSLMSFLLWYYGTVLQKDVDKFFAAYCAEEGYKNVAQASALRKQNNVDPKNAAKSTKALAINSAVAAIESYLSGNRVRVKSVFSLTKRGPTYLTTAQEELAA